MELTELISLSIFATVAAFTPGPNNLLLAASSANFGLRATWPHMAGVIMGFTLLVAIAAFGLGWLLTAIPMLQIILRLLGIVFITLIAYGLWISHTLEQQNATRPMRFIEAVLFQWINPKGVLVISEVAILITLFFWVTVGSVLVWAGAGAFIARKLTSQKRLAWFNRTAASLLLLSVAPVLLDLV